MKVDEARALMECRTDLPVTAVHEGLVFDVECDSCGMHTVVACTCCGLGDVYDEECPPVTELLSVLRDRGVA